MRRELIAVLVLASCGAPDPGGFTVPERCYAEGAIEITGLEDGEPRQLIYGPQGGQHVFPGIVLRGVDPRAATVQIAMTRELDGVTVAQQVFTRFEPGIGECDVAIPETELFVLSRYTDGMPVTARITAYHGMTSEIVEARGVCVSSTGGCGPHGALVVRAGGVAIEDGAVVSALGGELALEVEGTGIVWGRAGERTLELRASTPITLAVTPGQIVPIALALSPELPIEHGVLGVFEGTITIAP